jgi:hypothetical protein
MSKEETKVSEPEVQAEKKPLFNFKFSIGNAIAVIASAIAIYVGLAFKKLYDKYISFNPITLFIFNAMVALILIRFGLFILIPLVKGIYVTTTTQINFQAHPMLINLIQQALHSYAVGVSAALVIIYLIRNAIEKSANNLDR